MTGLFGGQGDRRHAIGLIVGAVVGVGIFGIPFAFVQSGFFVGMIYLVVIGFVAMTLAMMFAEVNIQTPGRHRMSGYVRRYFGKKWGAVAALVMTGSTWGGLLAYVLVGGEFFHALVSQYIGGTVFMYQLFFMVFGFIIALRGLSFVARTEAYLVPALLLVVSVIMARGFFDIDTVNYTTFTGNNIFLPYGVVLFSIGGLNVIPEIKDLLKKDSNSLRRVVPFGYLLIIALYAAFAAVVVGVTGLETTPESIVGLGSALGPWVLVLGSIMGLLAVSTSFIILSVEMQDMLEFDLGASRLLAWFATVSAPLFIFSIGARNFIEVISFTGAVFGGLMGIFVVMMYLRVRNKTCMSPAKCFAIPKWISVAILILFVTGILIGVLDISPAKINGWLT
ncbi:MAG TPA: aromatic amino acid transport family protein [Patescibacteria group bacterium]|nr:aromatic amino acid transport family protein [Patescibacteria group bacterium]